MNKARTRFVTIVDPRLQRQDTRNRNWAANDYITVPIVATYGTFNFGDFLSDDSIRNLLKAYHRSKQNDSATILGGHYSGRQRPTHGLRRQR
jgi:hypothetical protein